MHTTHIMCKKDDKGQYNIIYPNGTVVNTETQSLLTAVGDFTKPNFPEEEQLTFDYNSEQVVFYVQEQNDNWRLATIIRRGCVEGEGDTFEEALTDLYNDIHSEFYEDG